MLPTLKKIESVLRECSFLVNNTTLIIASISYFLIEWGAVLPFMTFFIAKKANFCIEGALAHEMTLLSTPETSFFERFRTLFGEVARLFAVPAHITLLQIFACFLVVFFFSLLSRFRRNLYIIWLWEGLNDLTQKRICNYVTVENIFCVNPKYIVTILPWDDGIWTFYTIMTPSVTNITNRSICILLRVIITCTNRS